MNSYFCFPEEFTKNFSLHPGVSSKIFSFFGNERLWRKLQRWSWAFFEIIQASIFILILAADVEVAEKVCVFLEPGLINNEAGRYWCAKLKMFREQAISPLIRNRLLSIFFDEVELKFSGGRINYGILKRDFQVVIFHFIRVEFLVSLVFFSENFEMIMNMIVNYHLFHKLCMVQLLSLPRLNKLFKFYRFYMGQQTSFKCLLRDLLQALFNSK